MPSACFCGIRPVLLAGRTDSIVLNISEPGDDLLEVGDVTVRVRAIDSGAGIQDRARRPVLSRNPNAKPRPYLCDVPQSHLEAHVRAEQVLEEYDPHRRGNDPGDDPVLPFERVSLVPIDHPQVERFKALKASPNIGSYAISPLVPRLSIDRGQYSQIGGATLQRMGQRGSTSGVSGVWAILGRCGVSEKRIKHSTLFPEHGVRVLDDPTHGVFFHRGQR